MERTARVRLREKSEIKGKEEKKRKDFKKDVEGERRDWEEERW